MRSRQRQTRATTAETLEVRLMKTVAIVGQELRIEGTRNSDEITIRSDDDFISVYEQRRGSTDFVQPTRTPNNGFILRIVVYAGEGNDLVRNKSELRMNAHGGPGHDELYGGAHVDMLWGDDGEDILYGNAGNDHLFGGADGDELYGGADRDKLWGGVTATDCTAATVTTSCTARMVATH